MRAGIGEGRRSGSRASVDDFCFLFFMSVTFLCFYFCGGEEEDWWVEELYVGGVGMTRGQV